jgi:hypothetical protein
VCARARTRGAARVLFYVFCALKIFTCSVPSALCDQTIAHPSEQQGTLSRGCGAEQEMMGNLEDAKSGRAQEDPPCSPDADIESQQLQVLMSLDRCAL